MKKKMLSILLAASLIISMSACGTSGTIEKEDPKETAKEEATTTPAEESAVEAEIVLQLAEIHTAGYPTAMADEEFARLVGEKTNGRIKVEVYTDATLGEEADVVEQMQMGTLAFARVSLAPMANFEPSLNALMMPFLYNDSEHMWKVLNSELGQTMLESISSAGLVGLCWYDGGSRCFYSNVKITKLSDMKGLTFRMQNNEMMFDLTKALGANAMNCGQGDVYQAVQDGTIDGAENNIPTYESFSQDEVCPYYIMDDHSRVPEILAGSEIALEVLSAEDQAIIKECAKETQEFEITAWAAQEIESKALVEKDTPDVEWVELEEGELEKFQAAIQPLYETYGAEYQDVIDQIIEMGK
ncbi:MAG: TRAP transporter substrate-binding protein [Mobilitalea sp.]